MRAQEGGMGTHSNYVDHYFFTTSSQLYIMTPITINFYDSTHPSHITYATHFSGTYMQVNLACMRKT